ncbi:MAG: hypothetical protein WBW78_08570 [Terrimicrobiaceae bacterium]
MSYRNDEARPYEDMRLSKLDMLRFFDQVCGAQHDRQSQHLMFWRRAEGFNPDPSNSFASFISKDCANTMNP